jgi:hypothetical protein
MASASVCLFSGRPDPAWPLNGRQVETLERLWAGLAPHPAGAALAPALGYRGCRVRSGDCDWLAYGGTVTRSPGAAQEARADPARAFERAVLASAPPGLLPAGALPPDLA